jgi:NAD(P)-dependent dehydrogenase (short-subunit alcohol dehydrogenase family)
MSCPLPAPGNGPIRRAVAAGEPGPAGHAARAAGRCDVRTTAVRLLSGVGTGWMATRALLHLGRRYELHGKTVLITGGSRGLGLAMAREFARRGARLAICARDAEELEIARVDLESRGAEVMAVRCDVTVREEAESLAQQVCARFGCVDVLVNNAGVIEVGPLESMTLEDFEDAMRIHFYGPLYLTLAVVPEMRRRRHGRVVNISSFGGLVSVPHLLPYCSSKFALTGFSEGLRAELARDQVLVTTVAPGFMRTGSARHAWFKGNPLQEFKWFRAGASLPLVTMHPERAARKIVAACQRGAAELILTPQAKLLFKAKALFPELVTDLMELADRALPDGFDGSREKVEGAELEPPRGGSLLDRLNRFAAMRFNEYAR